MSQASSLAGTVPSKGLVSFSVCESSPEGSGCSGKFRCQQRDSRGSWGLHCAFLSSGKFPTEGPGVWGSWHLGEGLPGCVSSRWCLSQLLTC